MYAQRIGLLFKQYPKTLMHKVSDADKQQSKNKKLIKIVKLYKKTMKQQ